MTLNPRALRRAHQKRGDRGGDRATVTLIGQQEPKIPMESQAPSRLVSVSVRDLTFNRGELDSGVVKVTVPLLCHQSTAIAL